MTYATQPSEERLRKLASGLGHDFANILAGILGNLHLAQTSLPKDSPVLEDLAEVESAARGGLALVRKIQLYAGRTKMLLVPLSLNALVSAEKARLVELSAGAALELSLEDDLPEIAGDGDLLKDVISSLVSNAREAIGERTGGRIRLATAAEGEEVRLEISDNGDGMTDEVRARAFDPYFTTRSHRKGLSLAVVAGAAAAHNAGLVIDSEPTRGTTLRLIFPRVLR